MINLLPAEEKQKLLLEKNEKLAIILGIIVSASLVCLILVLLSVKFYVLAETDLQIRTLEQIKQKNQSPDFANFSSIIKKYNGILSQINSFYKKEIYFSQALNIISNIQKSQNLYLTNFSLTRDENGKIKVDVSGTSQTRDDLLAFKKNIEEDKEIENPYFSPESWINPKNVNFSLTFNVSQNEKQK